MEVAAVVALVLIAVAVVVGSDSGFVEDLP